MSAESIKNKVGGLALIGIAAAGITILGLRSRKGPIAPPDGQDLIVIEPDPDPIGISIIKKFTQSVDSGTAILTVGYSIEPTDARASIRWDFGDASPEVLDEKIVNHNYFSAGVFNGFVEVTDSLGNSDRVNFSVGVDAAPSPPPGAVDVITNFFQSQSVIFAGQSVSMDIALGTPVRLIEWDFGDGTNRVLNNQSVDHTYRTEGIFEGFVRATAEDGTEETRNFTVQVTASPLEISASITIGPGAGATLEPNELIDFRASVGGGVPPFVNFEWEFGDGTRTSGLESIVQHAYATEGIFTVALIVTDSAGNTKCASRIVVIETRELQSGDVGLTIQATTGTFDFKFLIQNLRNDVAIDGRLLVRIFDSPGGGGRQLFFRTDQIDLLPGQIQFSNLILAGLGLPVGVPLVLDIEYKDNLMQRSLARVFETIIVQAADVEPVPGPEPTPEPIPEPIPEPTPEPTTRLNFEDFKTENVSFEIPIFQTIRTLPVQFRLPPGAVGVRFARVFVKLRTDAAAGADAKLIFNNQVLDTIKFFFGEANVLKDRDIVVTGLVRLNNDLNDLVIEFSSANFLFPATAFIELASVFVEWDELV